MKKRAVVILSVLLLCIISVFVFIQMGHTGKTVELMDLYGDISPLSEMGYGDTFVAEKVFSGLFDIGDDYSVYNGIATGKEESSNVITVTIDNVSFKLPGKDEKVTPDHIVEYYENLLRLVEAKRVSNPGLLNLKSVSVADEKVSFTFKDQRACNVLALTEPIGLEVDGKWYGTKSEIVYTDKELKVGNTSYIAAAQGTEMVGDERYTSMVLGTALAKDDTSIATERLPNNTYGFITWGKGCKLDRDTQKLIMLALESSKIRSTISFPADSIYSNTALASKLTANEPVTKEKLENLGLGAKESLRIGVIDLGSFSEIRDTLEATFKSLGIPAIVDTVDIADIVDSEDYDLIYVRLARGKSPDITGLFQSGSLLEGYAIEFEPQISAVLESKDIQTMNESLKVLDHNLRESGVWFFIDEGFDVKAIKKR